MKSVAFVSFTSSYTFTKILSWNVLLPLSEIKFTRFQISDPFHLEALILRFLNFSLNPCLVFSLTDCVVRRPGNRQLFERTRNAKGTLKKIESKFVKEHKGQRMYG